MKSIILIFTFELVSLLNIHAQDSFVLTGNGGLNFLAVDRESKAICYEVVKSNTFKVKWELDGLAADDPSRLFLSAKGTELVFIPETIAGDDLSDLIIMVTYSNGKITKKFLFSDLLDPKKEISRLPTTPEIIIIKSPNGYKFITDRMIRVLLAGLPSANLFLSNSHYEELFLFETAQGDRFLIDPKKGSIVYRGRIDEKQKVISEDEVFGKDSFK